jgi:hypothetical protein
MLLSVAAGTAVGMLLEGLGAPLEVSVGLCGLAVGTIEIMRAWRYAQPLERRRPVAAVELPSKLRRSLIRELVPAALLLLMAAFTPIPNIEAAVIGRRLRRLTDETSPPFDKIKALLESALQNDIPISVRSIDAAQYKVLRVAAQDTSSPSQPVTTQATNTFAQLEAYRLYSVAGMRMQIYVSILMPAAPFICYAPIYAHFASMLGSSRTASVFDVRFNRTEISAAALNYTYDPRVSDDILVANMTATGQSLALAEAPEFIRKAEGDDSRKVAISNVTISNLNQTLDGYLWVEVEFDNCVVTYRGGPIYLDRVLFRNCEFSVPNQADANVAENIKAQGTNAVTLKRAGRH